ncbi:replication fork protection component Swi3-domain-containing protein [Gloeopeniophorella convolvens]|nr:replication fork protection component Swi3-domain-containing protein [Gloeopeniophorella convolvens]
MATSMDVNDIWDLPAEPAKSYILEDTTAGNNDDDQPTTSARASKGPLFLPSDDEDDAPATGPGTEDRPDVNALFDDLENMDDDFQDLAPALDLDALRREADVRNTRAVRAELSATIPAASAAQRTTKKGPLDDVDDDGEEEGKKKRKPLPKLDETRLLGKNGFPQLVQDTKGFKPKGKGHESTDLDRVLQTYQFWTHRMYPKTKFKETVERVEKLCHSRRMQVALSVWRDDSKGLTNGLPSRPERDADSDADSDVVDLTRRDDAAADGQERTSPGPSSPIARSRLRRRSSATSDVDMDSDGPPPSSGASHPPTSSPGRDNADAELEALLEEEALHGSASAEPASHAWKKAQPGDAGVDDDDDAMWEALDAAAPPPVPAPPPTSSHMDDDEEMWDIMQELEDEQTKKAANKPGPAQPPPPPPPPTAETPVDDYEDLYL